MRNKLHHACFKNVIVQEHEAHWFSVRGTASNIRYVENYVVRNYVIQNKFSIRRLRVRRDLILLCNVKVYVQDKRESCYIESRPVYQQHMLAAPSHSQNP